MRMAGRTCVLSHICLVATYLWRRDTVVKYLDSNNIMTATAAVLLLLLVAVRPDSHRYSLRPPSISHRDINTGIAKPAS